MCFSGSNRSAFSRRQFLASLGAVGVASLSSEAIGTVSRFSAELQGSTQIANSTAVPVKNRTPLTGNAFYLLPLGSILPSGWLRKQLLVQAHGLGGHLDETWPDVGPNSGWLGGTGESWERGPYFLDGLVPLAYLLDDARLKAKAQKYLDWTLDHAESNGMIGPKSNDDWWPRMVMLKALTQYQEATTDPRVIPVLSKYFAYQRETLRSRPLRDWGRYRWHDEALSIIWLYNRTGDSGLLDLFKILQSQGFDWQAEFANFKYTERITPEFIKLASNSPLTDRGMQTHGVNIAMAVKMSPVRSLLTGSEADRRAALQMLEVLYRYHGLPNGIFSADEHLAGLNPSQGTELCTVVETMFSLEHSLAIMGDPILGDRLETLAFNAHPGAFTDDMWAHQYNQQPNQIVVSLQKEPWTTDGPESNLYGLDPNFGCCAANFHQGWPKFASSLFMLSSDDGLVAAAYAPCEVRTSIRNTSIHVIEETEYPFRGTIRLTISPASPLAFPLLLRIPAWAENASIKVNGKPTDAVKPASFAHIERTWRSGDVVDVQFPLIPRASQGYHGSLTFERGPLIFSYGIGEDWLKLRNRGMTADWQVYPTTPWNYAVDVNRDDISHSVSVVESKVDENPFTRSGAPVKLQVKARQVPSWLGENNVANPVPQSPVKSSEPEEQITLIPYAAAKLRITAFPELET